MRPSNQMIRVLCAGREGDLAVIRRLTATLTGIELVTVRSVDEAFVQVSEHLFDFLMLDLDTPVNRVSMLQLLEFIRRNFTGPVTLVGLSRQTRRTLTGNTHWGECDRVDWEKKFIAVFHDLHTALTL